MFATEIYAGPPRPLPEDEPGYGACGACGWADDGPATEAEADLEWVRNVGADHPERAWILSDRDCWYRNPAYSGPPVPHPESNWGDGSEFLGEPPAPTAEEQAYIDFCEADHNAHVLAWLLSNDDDIPF